MRSGTLRHRLAIQAKTSGSPQRSATGAAATGWATLLTVYGSLDALSGRRLEAAQATWPEAVFEATVRYRSEIADADAAATPLRIAFGGLFFPVGKVLDKDQTKVALRLLCKQGSARG